MKLPRTLTPRPVPRMPELAGFEARYDTIASLRSHHPIEVVRPLYWWACTLRDSGDVLVNAHFNATTITATVTVRLASYRILEVVRRHDDKPRLPRTVVDLLAEAVWRLGSLGWTGELEDMTSLLRARGLMVWLPRITPSTQYLPGRVQQPDRGVRIAYWWAAALKQHGWKLYACGDIAAQHGFIAEIPGADGGDPILAVYPGDMADDGTEASALANHFARLGATQRRYVQRVIDDTAAGQGRVS